MTQYEIPYICSKCNHDRWIVATPEDEDSKAVKCPECGYEDVVKLPMFSDESGTVVNGMDELTDFLDNKINKE